MPSRLLDTRLSSTVAALLLAVAALACMLPAAHATNADGVAFLDQNKNKPGVNVLKSGLQYKILSKGKGDAHPKVSTPCECHYEGRTAQNYPDGDTFDSSYKRGNPLTFAPNQVIKGWTEAMQMVRLSRPRPRSPRAAPAD